MPVQPDFYTAMTNPGGVDAVALRNSLRKRVAYVLAANESAQDLIATDPITGVSFLTLVQNGRVYALDPLDSSSEHDGVTVLVTYDGLVYKLDTLVVPYAVISKSYTSPPLGSILGDSYLVVGAGSGDWAGKGPLVSLTGWGWESVSAPPGRLIYVEDEDSYYHIDRYGNVLAGFGSAALTDGSVLVRHFLGGGRSFKFTVVNQTTNAPPLLSGSGTQYIVGSAPTGAWAGKPGYIAIDEGTQWGLYQPALGWQAYDQTLKVTLIFDGANWSVASGVVAAAVVRFTGRNASAISGNVSAVDTTNDFITWSVNHNLTTGQLIVMEGVPPQPILTDAPYFVRSLSATTFALYTTKADALADTNRVNFTTAGSGTRTAKLFGGRSILTSLNVSDVSLISSTFSPGGTAPNFIRALLTFGSAQPDTNYQPLMATLSRAAGSNITDQFSGLNPLLKTTTTVTYVGGVTWDVANAVFTPFTWDKLLSSDSLDVSFVIQRA